MEKMNSIVHIDELNLQVTVEPGVITQVLQETVAAKGLYYPPDPSSRGSCFIGGNLAENAGGPRAVKYGVTKDFVLNLEVVLANGQVIHTGANTLKNSTGYNLTQLMVGSEGTLGIITKAVLKLVPLPKHNLLMLVPFFDAAQACEAVSAIFRAGITPSALEFMERDAIDWVLQFVDDVHVPVEKEIQAHLLIEVDGNHMDALMADCEVISEVVQQFNCGEILFADDEAQKAQLWKLRRKVAEAVKSFDRFAMVMQGMVICTSTSSKENSPILPGMKSYPKPSERFSNYVCRWVEPSVVNTELDSCSEITWISPSVKRN